MNKFKIAKNVVEVAAMVVGVANQVKELNVKNEDGQNFFVIPNLTGSDVLKTKELLEEKGFTVVTTPAIPNQKWIGKRRNEVVQMEPKAGKIATNTIIKLIYVDDEVINKSKQIILDEKKQRKEFQDNIDGAIKEAQKMVGDVGKQGQKFAGDAVDNAGTVADQAIKGIQGIFFKKSKSQDKK